MSLIQKAVLEAVRIQVRRGAHLNLETSLELVEILGTAGAVTGEHDEVLRVLNQLRGACDELQTQAKEPLVAAIERAEATIKPAPTAGKPTNNRFYMDDVAALSANPHAVAQDHLAVIPPTRQDGVDGVYGLPNAPGPKPSSTRPVLRMPNEFAIGGDNPYDGS